MIDYDKLFADMQNTGWLGSPADLRALVKRVEDYRVFADDLSVRGVAVDGLGINERHLSDVEPVIAVILAAINSEGSDNSESVIRDDKPVISNDDL